MTRIAPTPPRKTTPDAIFAANARDAHPTGGKEPQSWAEVHAWCSVHAPHLVQHIAKLAGKLDFGPLETLHLGNPDFAGFRTLAEWTEHHFPKVRKGAMPQIAVGYGMTLDAYKTTRQKLLKALKDFIGETAAREARNARRDGWCDVLALLRPLTENTGPLPKVQYGVVAKAADFARQADITPWQLDDAGAGQAIADILPAGQDRAVVDRAFRILNDWRDLLDFDDLLPRDPIPALPARPVRDRLPDHVDAFITKVVEGAAHDIDPNTGKRHPRVSATTIAVYRAALCHHLRLLPLCPADAEMGYATPISDLHDVNDIAKLFDPDHISATIRATEERDHLPCTPTATSCRRYYHTIHHVLSEYDRGKPLEGRTFLPEMLDTIRVRIERSNYLKRTSAADSMTPKNEQWCRDLVTDPVRERRFHNLHRIFQARAQEILKRMTDTHGVFHADRLGDHERSQLMQLGTAAAAVAIVVTGRPLRIGNVLGLRLRGQRCTIDRKAGWTFWIPGEEAKAGKDIPPATPSPGTHGPQVLDWYFREIRPLLDPGNTSIYLFPAAKDPEQPLSKNTFRTWFQRAASQADIPMTFHMFRHGWASILLKEGVALEHIADMLGNTVAVCARNYAFLDSDHVIETTQAAMVARAKGLGRPARRGTGRRAQR